MTEIANRTMHRKYFSVLGWALLIYLLIMNAWVVAFAVIDSVVLGFRQGAGEHFTTEQIDQILMSNGWGYFASIATGLIILRVWKGKGFCYKTLWTRGHPMKFGSFMALLCIFISGQFLFQILASIQEAILNAFGLSALEAIESATMDYDSLSMFLYAAIGAPIMEEIVFRGVALRYLEPYGKGFAVVMSAFLFGIFHGNIVQIPYAFLVGLVLGYVAMEYNILWAMVLHMINNLVLGDLVSRLLPEMAANAVLNAVILGCTLAALIILAVKRKDILGYCRANPMKDADAGNFFTAPGVLALEIFTLYAVASPLVAQIAENMGY